jgi:co-chaperonin GroES (HSP10)
MEVSVNYCVVKKVEEPKVEGFKTVEVQDSFVYKGQIVKLPTSQPAYMGDRRLAIGDIVLFAKYSPDTIEVELEGEKQKFVKLIDILAVL